MLYAILNAACLITVPLINWSGTLRRLGQKAASLKDPNALRTNGDVGTRTIVIYWAFLVLVGFICIWYQIQYGANFDGREYPDLTRVICNPGTNGSMFMSPNGTFHRRAIDYQFIQDNGCTDPCNLVNIPSIFRNQNELTMLPHSEALLWNYTIPGQKYMNQEKMMSVENHLFSLNYWSLPFIVLQGFITAFFGRRDPREIRDLIYITLYMERRTSNMPWLRAIHEGAVRAFAGLNYLIACAVVLVCVPLFVISIIGQELQLWNNQPDSEKAYQVGQWSPWVYTVLVILAALIARYHDRAIESISTAARSIFSSHRKNHQENEPEHGIPSETEKRSSTSTSDPSKSDDPSSITEMRPSSHPTSAPTKTTEIESTSPKSTLRQALANIYTSSCHPLNQSGNGPIDELRNFYRWCRNPQGVSRMVVRHPIRQREERFIDAPLEIEGESAVNGDQTRGFWRGASVEYKRGLDG